MRLLVVNSNTSAAVTETIRLGALAAASPGTEIVAVTAPFGVSAIESVADARIAAEATLAAIAAHTGGVDAAVIACFSDPGLDEARRRFPFPVVGIAEAAMLAAAEAGPRFAILTVAPSTVPGIEALAARYGHAGRLAGVHALATGVLASHSDAAATAQGLAALAAACTAAGGVSALILGGAVTAGLQGPVSAATPLPVFEGVQCAIRRAESLGAP